MNLLEAAYYSNRVRRPNGRTLDLSNDNLSVILTVEDIKATDWILCDVTISRKDFIEIWNQATHDKVGKGTSMNVVLDEILKGLGLEGEKA